MFRQKSYDLVWNTEKVAGYGVIENPLGFTIKEFKNGEERSVYFDIDGEYAKYGFDKYKVYRVPTHDDKELWRIVSKRE